jgi:hypothetical protein
MPGVPSSRGRVPTRVQCAWPPAPMASWPWSWRCRARPTVATGCLCAGGICARGRIAVSGEARESDCTRLPIGICGVGVQLCWE